MSIEIECIQQANAILGEGPIWDWRSGDVFWVDIRRQQVFRHHFATGVQTGQWTFPERVGFVALTESPTRVVVGVGMTVQVLDLISGETHLIAELDSGRPQHRINDAAVDADGRLWVGTMMDDYFNPRDFIDGRLHRVDADGTTQAFGTYQLPNGIGWSPDGTQMYLNDSVARKTYAIEFDRRSGTVGDQRPIFVAAANEGLPDGLSVDADGNIWCALWDGWAVLTLSPDGNVLARHAMPVRRPSSATFGGEGLDQLIVTSATVDFSSFDYAASPQAGGLFCMPVGRRGQRANLFALPVQHPSDETST